jgi:hypothetical protein
MPELRNRTHHTTSWNADDIDQMAELIRSGRSLRDVSTQLGRSEEAVRTKARSLDMLPRRSGKSKFLLQ